MENKTMDGKSMEMDGKMNGNGPDESGTWGKLTCQPPFCPRV
jgi:hypothetical protein